MNVKNDKKSLVVSTLQRVLGISTLALGLVLTSCSDDDTTTSSGTSGTGSTTSGSVSISSPSTTSSSKAGLTLTGADTSDTFNSSAFTQTVTIALSGSTATVTGSVSGVTVTTSGSNISIASTASGVNYVVSGTTTSGSLSINSTQDFQLSLSGANITNASGAAVTLGGSSKAFVRLSGTNTLTDGSSSSAEATLLSAGSLLFSGSGSLSVAGKKNDAIQATSTVRLTDATLTISEAVNDGIQAGTLFVMDSGTLNITSAPTVSYSKGVSVLKGYLIVNDGTVTINTTASAGLSNQYVSSSQSNESAYSTIINGGTITISSTSTSAEVEGIESNHGSVSVNDGTLVLKVTDDAINGESAVNINGGKTYAYVTGNDAIDSNGNMYITGGVLVAVSTASSPETSLDSDSNTFNISGGIVVALSAGASPSSPSASTQPVVLLGSGSTNQIVNIQDSSSNEIVTFLAPAAYSNILISTPKLSKSTTYKLYKGGSVTDATSFNGLYTAGTYSGGTLSSSFTTGSTSYTQVK